MNTYAYPTQTHARTYPSSTERSFLFPTFLVLFFLTCIGATVYAVVTQPAHDTEKLYTNAETPSDVSITPEALARTSFTIRTVPNIPSEFIGTLISLTESHALIEYRAPTPTTFENPENGTRETIHQSTYVVTNVTPQTILSLPQQSFEPGTAVSVHIQTKNTNSPDGVTYTLSHMQPAPQKSGA